MHAQQWAMDGCRVTSPAPAFLCAAGRRRQSSTAAGRRCSCSRFSAEPLGPRRRPSTLDHPTAPSKTFELYTYIHSCVSLVVGSKRLNQLVLDLPAVSSDWLWAWSADAFTLVGEGSCVCVCRVQSPRRHGRGSRWACECLLLDGLLSSREKVM